MNSDDIKTLSESLAAVIGYVGELSLEVATCRALLLERGVTKEDFDLTYQQLKRHQDFQLESFVKDLVDRQTAARLRRILEEHEGTKQ